MRLVIICAIILFFNACNTSSSNIKIIGKWQGRLQYNCKDSKAAKVQPGNTTIVNYQFNKDNSCNIEETVTIGGTPTINHSWLKYKTEGDSVIWLSHFAGGNLYVKPKSADTLYIEGQDEESGCLTHAFLKKV